MTPDFPLPAPEERPDDFLNDVERSYFADLPRIPSWVKPLAREGELKAACAEADAFYMKRRPEAKVNSWARTLLDIEDVNRKGRHADLSHTGE